MNNLYTKLTEIQQKLNAPKTQFNAFGKYNYRNLEDILTAVKPLLGETALIINDEIVNVGERYYVKATVTLTDGETSISNTAFAREALDKKGMDESQITGAASSYARKYALNGLFAIDDNKDADSMDNRKALKKSDPIMDVTKDQDSRITSKCLLCGTTNQYHKPACPNQK